jgi:ABC-2 type transport system permease protein
VKPLQKYAKSLALGMQSAMEYRADFLLGMVSAIWPMFIQFFMWTSIYQGSSQPVMFGYTYAQMITYTIIANIVQRLLRTGFEYEINDDIKNGGLDKFMVRPIGYFQFRMASFLGGKLVQSGLIYIVLIAVVVIINAVFGALITPLHLLYFTVVLLLACVLNYIIFFCVGLLAFWLTEIGFFFEAVRIVFIAFSGGIFPLDVFGPKVVAVMNFLPFKYTVNFPVDVLNGRLGGGDILTGCAVMLLWVVLLSAFSQLVWKAGLKRYVAAGG